MITHCNRSAQENKWPKRFCFMAAPAPKKGPGAAPEKDIATQLKDIEALGSTAEKMNQLGKLYAEVKAGIKKKAESILESKESREKGENELLVQLQSKLKMKQSLVSDTLPPHKLDQLQQSIAELEKNIARTKALLAETKLSKDHPEELQQILLSQSKELLEVQKHIAEVMVNMALEVSEKLRATKSLDKQKPWDDVYKGVIEKFPEYKEDDIVASLVYKEIYRQHVEKSMDSDIAHIADVLSQSETPEELTKQLFYLFLEARIFKHNLLTWDTPEKMADGLKTHFEAFVKEKTGTKLPGVPVKDLDVLIGIIKSLFDEGKIRISDAQEQEVDDTIIGYRESADKTTGRDAYLQSLQKKLGRIVNDKVTGNGIIGRSLQGQIDQALSFLERAGADDKDGRKAAERILSQATSMLEGQQSTSTAPKGITWGFVEGVLGNAPNMRELNQNPLKYLALGLGVLWGGASLLLNNMRAFQNLWRGTGKVFVDNISLNPLKGFGLFGMLRDAPGAIGSEIFGVGKEKGEKGMLGNIFLSTSLMPSLYTGALMMAAANPEKSKALLEEMLGSELVTTATGKAKQLYNEGGELISSGFSAAEKPWNEYIGGTFGDVTDNVISSWENMSHNLSGPMKENHRAIGTIASSLPGITPGILPISTLNAYALKWDGKSDIPKDHLAYILNQNVDHLTFTDGEKPLFSMEDKWSGYMNQTNTTYLGGELEMGITPGQVWPYELGAIKHYLPKGITGLLDTPITQDQMAESMKGLLMKVTTYFNGTRTNRPLTAARSKQVEAMKADPDKAKSLMNTMSSRPELLSSLNIPDFTFNPEWQGELSEDQLGQLIDYSLFLDMAGTMLNGKNPVKNRKEQVYKWDTTPGSESNTFYTALRGLKSNVSKNADPGWFDGTVVSGGWLSTIGTTITESPFQLRSPV